MQLTGRTALVTGGSRGIGRAIAVALAEAGADVAVNYVSSETPAKQVVEQIGNFGQANYAASKAGVAAMTKSLAKELAAKGITVNAVAPGFTETEMIEAIPEKVRNKLLEQIPMRRFGKSEEVARACVYLCSTDADYITGAELSINGGLFM